MKLVIAGDATLQRGANYNNNCASVITPDQLPTEIKGVGQERNDKGKIVKTGDGARLDNLQGN